MAQMVLSLAKAISNVIEGGGTSPGVRQSAERRRRRRSNLDGAGALWALELLFRVPTRKWCSCSRRWSAAERGGEDRRFSALVSLAEADHPEGESRPNCRAGAFGGSGLR
jgi:hypothetical protein